MNRVSVCIDVPRPLTNFYFKRLNVECVKRASQDGISVFVRALIVNVNKCLKPFFLFKK